jgi:hypothetical protein
MDLKEFDDLATLGQVTKTVKLGAHEFKMHTLNSREYGQMTARLSEDKNQAARFEELQRWTLAYAIGSVDDKKVRPEQVELLLQTGQLALSNALYNEYVTMMNEQEKLLQEVKKNSSPAVPGLT